MGRRLGQHFLVRQSILERIARAACPESCNLVVEIGPGKGALTSYLLQRAERVVAIEVDPILVQYLRSKYRDNTRLQVIEGDVLKTGLGEWGALTIAGNLPYYIASPIIAKVLGVGAHLQRAVFLVQKEVAERLTASPGSRDYGYLSVQTQLLAEVELLFPVPAAAFQPPPNVDSAVVGLTPRRKLATDDPEGFLRFAARCFQHKRKTLRNNLLPFYAKEALDALPAGKKRAEQLDIAELVELYKTLAGASQQRA